MDPLTETIAARQATFSFEQMVQTEEKKPEEEKKAPIPPLPIFQGIQHYVESEHILLVGSPGVGKSTALWGCLVDFAKKELEKPKPRIPVLIPLKSYKVSFFSPEDPSGMLTLIRNALKPQLRLTIPEVEDLLFQERLILLLDGLNEMPAADTVRTQLKTFREQCEQIKIPLICTTRELGNGDLGIKRRLQVQPLDSREIDRFLRECMPGQAQQVLQLLSRDNRELSRTPFVLWMLYQLFQETGTVVDTLGQAFRQFFQTFKKYKEGAPVTDERRKAWNPWLEHLAFTMLKSPEPTDPGLIISDERAENLLVEKFGDLHGTPSRIEELVKYHVLERVSDREVSFQHQLIQEYYAAEYLLRTLPKLLNDEEGETKLKCHYLNYRKWTEPIAIMLGLPEITEEQVEKLIALALDVDLTLGARLAGAVKPEPDLQQKTVSMIASQEVPEWLRIFLLGETKSPQAAHELMKTIKDPNPVTRRNSVFALRQLNSEAAMPLIDIAIEDSDPDVRKTAIRVIGELGIKDEKAIPLITKILNKEQSDGVREAVVVFVLSKLDSEAAIMELLKITQDRTPRVRKISRQYLEKKNREIVINFLIKFLKNSDNFIRKSAISLLGELGNEIIIPNLFEAQLDLSTDVHNAASEAIFNVRRRVQANESGVIERQQMQQQDQINMERGYLDSEEYIRRGNAIHSLASLLAKEEVIPLIEKALDDPHPYVRGHAITHLLRLMGNEAIPQAIRALDDPNYQVRDNAAQALAGLRQNLPEKLEIPEETVSKLIEILNKDEDTSVRSVTIDTLTNLCSVQPSLVGKDLESAFLNASYSSDPFLRSKAAQGLQNFGSDRVSIRLLEMVEDPHFLVVLNVAETLKNMPYNIITAKHLPALRELIYTLKESFALEAVAAIQSRCGFYNYEIAQSPLPVISCPQAANFNSQTIVAIMTDKQPIIFNQPNSTIGNSYAAEGSHVNIQQNVKNVTEQDRTELEGLLIQLAQTYPITTETQKQTFIEKFLERIESTPGSVKVLLAGGIEWLKIIHPAVGIPIEMLRRLYQAVEERHNQP
ncbi:MULTISPECIES: HEAT repeat domain-containing protein [unclassified Microcoleus]|uniref:HEAT repeat domain-containing protein n=1 Tax=unclassified Microcoleus TaxID=2642155 RepID=UPI0040408568